MLEETNIGMEEIRPFLAFNIESEEFGVDVMNIMSVTNITAITRVPRAPKFIQGVINLRGRILPVINLRKRFGFKLKKTDENSRIIIAEVEGEAVGMIADSVSEVLRIPLSDIEPIPGMIKTGVSKEYLQSIAKIDNRLIIILNLIKVLNKTEIDDLKEFKEKTNKKSLSNVKPKKQNK